MKKIYIGVACVSIIIASFAVANLFFGVGIGVYRLPAPSERFQSNRGVARDYKGAYDINIDNMIPFMRDAKWTAKHFLWKWPVDVELRNGEHFRIDAIGYFFQIDGVKGTFFLDGVKASEFEKVSLKVIRR
jgi:hypothetical protein